MAQFLSGEWLNLSALRPAKQDYRKWNNNATVSAVLRYFKSVSLMGNVTKHSEDEIDAIISSAALRALSHLKDCWYPSNLDKETRRFEGWIFGSY